MIGAINCGVSVKSFNNYQCRKIQFDCETKAVFSKRPVFQAPAGPNPSLSDARAAQHSAAR